MFFAQQNTPNDLHIYHSFLEDYLNGDEAEKEKFTKILTTAKSVLNGEKEFYEVDRNLFSIVLLLVDKHPDQLRDLNTENIEQDAFVQLKDHLEEALTTS